ncbi:MAG: RDD family protein, partial [Alphaproteobacteria bacterium]|nr:RDD family protein [Alphaproteobacteria bacterium]
MIAASPALNPVINKKIRMLVTPEGVAFHIEIASYGARIAAYIIDLILIYGTLLVLILLGLWLADGKLGAWENASLGIIGILLFFGLRNFWFILFEMGPRGATPGKQFLRLRVIARDGGRLNAANVVARNLMRELEVTLPFAFIALAQSLYGWLAGGWILCFILFPLLNRDRMRVGDLVGGTWVITVPRSKILPRIGEDVKHHPVYAFSAAQLDAYGAYELQMLENILRGTDH